MKIKFIFTLLVSLCGINISKAQQTKKPDKPNLYVYFEEKMRGEHEVSTYKADNKDYGIYVFEVWEPRKRTLYNTVDLRCFQLVDSAYLKTIDVKPSEFLIDYNNFVPDPDLIRSKKYKQVFIVEKMSENQFKIIEIVCYIGDIFFAPQRRTNADILGRKDHEN